MAYQWFVWIGKPWNGASLTILCLPRWWQNCPSSPPFLRIQRTANGVTPKLSLIRQLGRRDKEKTREKAEARSRIGTEWEGKYACRGERARIYSIRVHMLLHFWAQGFYLFLRWLIRRSRTTRPRKNVFYFLKRDVWRQFHCAFHSVGRFEIQARIPFVLEQRGDKTGDGRREREGERVGEVTRGEEGDTRRERLCIGAGRITRGEKVFWHPI